MRPPSCRGSTKVRRPTCVVSPGRCPAISRNSCEMQPSGRFYASIALLSARSHSFGTSDQCPPTARLIRPACADGSSPRSLPSPGAAANTSVIPVGSAVPGTASRARESVRPAFRRPRTRNADRVAVAYRRNRFRSRDNLVFHRFPRRRPAARFLTGEPVRDPRVPAASATALRRTRRHARPEAAVRNNRSCPPSPSVPSRFRGNDVVFLRIHVQHGHRDLAQIDASCRTVFSWFARACCPGRNP